MNNPDATSLQPGRYRHYKGGEDQVISVATHSETGEHLVVYSCLYENGSWWVRPLDMFTGQVNAEGTTVDRFTLLHHETLITNGTDVE